MALIGMLRSNDDPKPKRSPLDNLQPLARAAADNTGHVSYVPPSTAPIFYKDKKNDAALRSVLNFRGGEYGGRDSATIKAYAAMLNDYGSPDISNAQSLDHLYRMTAQQYAEKNGIPLSEVSFLKAKMARQIQQQDQDYIDKTFTKK